MRLANSPFQYLVDDWIEGVMQEDVYQVPILDADELR